MSLEDDFCEETYMRLLKLAWLLADDVHKFSAHSVVMILQY